jgi:hypothetical protein
MGGVDSGFVKALPSDLLKVINYISLSLGGERVGERVNMNLFSPHLHPLPVEERRFFMLFSNAGSFPYCLKIISKRRIEIMDPLLHFFHPNINCPSTPIFLFRIHP